MAGGKLLFYNFYKEEKIGNLSKHILTNKMTRIPEFLAAQILLLHIKEPVQPIIFAIHFPEYCLLDTQVHVGNKLATDRLSPEQIRQVTHLGIFFSTKGHGI